MKKISRCDLDTLASKFDAIQENERAQYVGGDWYYDYMGNPIGQIGSGDEIRILAPGTYTADITGDGIGTLFSESTNASAKSGILSSFVTANYSGSITASTTLQSNEALAVSGSAGSCNSFVYNESSNHLNNYYNMQNLVVHENYHIDNGHLGNGQSQKEKDRGAWLDAVNHSSFQSTSEDHRWNAMQQLLKNGMNYDNVLMLAQQKGVNWP